MRSRRLVSLLLAAAATIATVSAVGCYADDGYGYGYGYDGYYSPYGAPPSPYYEAYGYYPGYIWVNGYWWPHAGSWAWHRGYYTHSRTGYYYAQPHWAVHGGQHVFVRGGWAHGGAYAHGGGYHGHH